ncbi:uncharacterized protein YndB with AHSA1/START domain [Diaminobutyricimonas aerilata]|uniref:Uncharacterized protein YndB with AHSA1/START domain n=1 Tax=Diaminobutyricimonas aerilata TaxID=1162967 RepID=A0A2M9CL85_9MICO|nr:hypothetical protein [Diaminobutyricimonas aerilata]PJJ72660.1 uncharacterized protein YndB with AHSA1/START domain [Diaminobutyricimonas aerilata]
MAPRELERVYDVAPAIVWDALVDPVLLEGWLGRVSAPLTAGAHVVIQWLDPHHEGSTVTTVVHATTEHELELGGDIAVVLRLEATPGGPRGTRTRLRVDVPGAPAEGRAHAAAHLEALADLLHGHPVVWERWDDDYAAFTASVLSRPSDGTTR